MGAKRKKKNLLKSEIKVAGTAHKAECPCLFTERVQHRQQQSEPSLATLPACFNAGLGGPPRRGYCRLGAHAVFGLASEAASKDAN